MLARGSRASDLAEAAGAAEHLDRRLEQLHTEVHDPASGIGANRAADTEVDDALMRQLWELSRRTRHTA